MSEEQPCDERAKLLAAVASNGFQLSYASAELRCDRDIVLAAVSQTGFALQWAAAELQSDRDVIMAAVSKNGEALEWAAEEFRSDRDVVMAAISNYCQAIKWASAKLRSDREVVAAAVVQGGSSEMLRYAGDEILEDETFAVEARRTQCFFKITTLSGRSCIVALNLHLTGIFPGLGYAMLGEACNKLQLDHTGDETLLYGSELVRTDTPLRHWPGFPNQGGGTVEYQLIKSKHPRAA
mmetsp:Transcript_13138/g.24212  ORF Transcript_13138/g.24212 Transcript_13138/m.24212 type:complete len:238 (+) Transcript_13138:82-795(+)